MMHATPPPPSQSIPQAGSSESLQQSCDFQAAPRMSLVATMCNPTIPLWNPQFFTHCDVCMLGRVRGERERT